MKWDPESTVVGWWQECLRDAVRRKWCDKWQGEWFLHHNNAPSHTSLVVQQFLAKKRIPVITQSPYSPDLALNDFWLFPTQKMGFKGMRFATMEDIKSNATAELRKIPKEAFRRCFQQWQDRWSVCVHKGTYFEADKVSVVICPTITVLYHISGNFLNAPHMSEANIMAYVKNLFTFFKLDYYV